MESTAEPKRVVLRFCVDYAMEEEAIINDFFTKFGLDPGDDYYYHYVPPHTSMYVHILLDMYCKTNPEADLDTVTYEIFKVKKNTSFHFLPRGDIDYARERCRDYLWGSELRRSVEDYDDSFW
ncbi:uncharacterized protein PV06_08302 [Exophiala oligosperma]|uniref:Uncharacterized protein n=2 Tax=Chaetothyriales TaxID=34395 RepID=A0A0D2D9B4_9EURO|nr:uncharacterized protein PV06_08302 [Exophiala oligosperma]KAJ9644787.1 hypothetical protein H2204_001249 [Knufia peltigerae]KIW39713.1 hypothetical protein PV06_08302 [Exophiala oligosperma]